MSIIPVILSGGSGSRLWPVSRASYPKQLLPLWGQGTLLQQTVKRAAEIAGGQQITVVSSHDHRFQVAEQIRSAGISTPRILLETIRRNTAPAIAFAALDALQRDDNPLLLVLASDHMIKKPAVFKQAVLAAVPFAEQGFLMTFGVQPDRPETGYGYIKAKQTGISPIASFTEKPNAAVAQQYVDSGEYYWNSGMFLFQARAFLDELTAYAPAIYKVCTEAYQGIEQDLDFLRIPEKIFAACPSNSIDYAVMEKTAKAMVVPTDAGWSDLGSWGSLWEISDKDSNSNMTVGDVVLQDVSDSYVRSESRLVSVLGMKNCIVVETPDAVLVADKSQVENIKTVVENLRSMSRTEADVHRRVYRPWGSYENMDSGDRFTVKHITVKPGASLSLQMHHHRAEHWVVVRGTAKVTCGEKQFIVAENESTYIPLGIKHRLENPGSIDLELIEVQSGSYLGEDDIVRFDDKYGR
jgi:mannose-1-phosphate guanylyltransferase/mannose-6-phosphate isomerase